MQSFLANRFERKYVLTETRARQVRAWLRTRVEPDEHLTAEHPRGYPVYSLYLDTRELTLYRTAAEGHKNRFKLRIRYYDDGRDSPIFCEIKRRADQVIRKQRAGVHRRALDALLSFRDLPDSALLNPARERRDLLDFQGLQRNLDARPTLIVGYNREAYLDVSTSNARLTFDRDLRALAYDPDRGLHTDLPLVNGHEDKVIFEIKYVNRWPRWLQELVHIFQLERQSVPKYGWSVESFGENRVRRDTRRPVFHSQGA